MIYVPWDKQETALLMDAYLRVKNKEVSQQEAVKEVSELLRRRAILSGKEIDDVFRNVNGVGMQMKIVGGLIDDCPSGLHSGTKMFNAMVMLYKCDPASFCEILNQAKAECGIQMNLQEKFFAWLKNRVSSAQLSEFYVVCKEIESFCLSKRILTQPLFETTNTVVIQDVINTIKANRTFQFEYFRHLGKMRKVMDFYMRFLQEAPWRQSKKPEEVLACNNETATHSEKCIEEQNPAIPNIKSVAMDAQDKATSFVNEEENALTDNDNYKDDEANCSKRSALAKSVEKNAADASICVSNGMPTATQTPAKEDTAPRQQIKESEKVILPDMEKIVLRADMDGMSYDDLKNALQITTVLTRQLVAQSTKIVDIKGILIHEESFIDWKDGANVLEVIIEKLMKKNNGYVSSTQLFEYARIEMNMFLNDNGMCEERAVYDIAQHLFEKVHYHEKTYVFRGKMHISRADTEISSNLDVYRKYAADQGGIFYFNGLIEYLESIGAGTGNLRNQMRMWTEPIFFFYDYDVIATAEALHIDEDWKMAVKKSLDILFDDVGDHMILRNIPQIWFDRLPAISGNHQWTPLLLQSVLRFYNKELGARTIQAMDGQSLETLHAMLVANNSLIQNFGDVVISYLLERHIECGKFGAEELRLLLVDGGILHGNELIGNMPKALKQDERFAWDASSKQVTIKI